MKFSLGAPLFKSGKYCGECGVKADVLHTYYLSQPAEQNVRVLTPIFVSTSITGSGSTILPLLYYSSNASNTTNTTDTTNINNTTNTTNTNQTKTSDCYSVICNDCLRETMSNDDDTMFKFDNVQKPISSTYEPLNKLLTVCEENNSMQLMKEYAEFERVHSYIHYNSILDAEIIRSKRLIVAINNIVAKFRNNELEQIYHCDDNRLLLILTRIYETLHYDVVRITDDSIKISFKDIL